MKWKVTRMNQQFYAKIMQRKHADARRGRKLDQMNSMTSHQVNTTLIPMRLKPKTILHPIGRMTSAKLTRMNQQFYAKIMQCKHADAHRGRKLDHMNSMTSHQVNTTLIPMTLKPLRKMVMMKQLPKTIFHPIGRMTTVKAMTRMKQTNLIYQRPMLIKHRDQDCFADATRSGHADAGVHHRGSSCRCNFQ